MRAHVVVVCGKSADGILWEECAQVDVMVLDSIGKKKRGESCCFIFVKTINLKRKECGAKLR